MLCMNSVPNIILLIEMHILFIMIFYSLGPLRIVIFLIGDQLRRSGKGKGKGSTQEGHLKVIYIDGGWWNGGYPFPDALH